MVAPLTNPPYWPYPLAFAAPHRCYGNAQKCPTRSHGVMEMIMNELDPREEPGHLDEQVRCDGGDCGVGGGDVDVYVDVDVV